MFLIIGFSMFFINSVAAQSCAYSCTEVTDINGHSISFSSLLPSNSKKHLAVLFLKIEDDQSGTSISDFQKQFQESVDTLNNTVILMVTDHNESNLFVRNWAVTNSVGIYVYIDHNGNAKRQFSICTVPYLLIFDANGKILLRQTISPDIDNSSIFEKISRLE